MLLCVRSVENDLLLMATHFIEKDREYRNTSRMRGSDSSRRSRMVGCTPLTPSLSLTSSSDCSFLSVPLKGGLDCLMSIPCLGSQGCVLNCLSHLLLFLSCHFSANGPFSSLFSRKFSNIFCLQKLGFSYGIARR